MDQDFHRKQVHFPYLVKPHSAGAGRDIGYLLCAGDNDSPYCAAGAALWGRPGAPWYYFSCEYADWIFHAAYRYEPLYCQLSF